MGTVGLSFGSPTSGDGFDVSTTVASIVANLRNVETPWKTQLTSLESQDTAISSLGTLLSNLSNDVSALTEFSTSGVMALKTGSSSDTNVLQLTAATSSAVAFTHTVTVTNLAQTSSGYLAEVSNASATLSGSITLQVGDGKTTTFTLDSSDNTLAGLEAKINSSGMGITANVLTDSTGSRLSLASGTSGAAGNITVSANSITTASANTLSYTATSGATNSGTLSAASSASDLLTGSISVTVGSGSVQTYTIPAGGQTLQQITNAINASGSGLTGVTASVVTNIDGSSSLSLTSGTNGALAVTSAISDPTTLLGYTSAVTGKDANLSIDGISLNSSSNTISNMIPGVTFQLLAPSTKESDGSLEQVQVVIGNDNSGIESTVANMVSDYNSLISAINTQDGNDSSGNAEPLFGSPTLSLLQEQLLSSLNTQNPNGYVDAIASNTDTTLSGSISVTAGSGAAYTFVIGAGTNTANTFYTGSGNNTLDELTAAINAANKGTTLSYTNALSYTAATGATNSGTLGEASSASDLLTGSISVTVGSGSAQTYTIPTGGQTLQQIADAINATGTGLTGVTASVVDNSDGTFSLSLDSGTNGALAVTSGISDSAAAATSATGYLAGINSGTTISGSLAFTVGTGTTESIVIGAAPSTGAAANTFYTGTASGYNTLAGLASSINSTSGLGVTASVVTDSNGVQTLSLTSTSGAVLSVGANILAAGPGVTATVDTDGTQQTLSLLSQTAGASGALTVNSGLSATSAELLSYSGTAGTTTTDANGNTTNTTSTGNLATIPSADDVLTGSISIAVGSGTAQTYTIPSGGETLQQLVSAINDPTTGISSVTASVATNGDNMPYLSLVSNTPGSAGTMIVTSNILDNSSDAQTTTALSYTNSGDISTMANLGITISSSDNGTLEFDASTLDSVLNSDFSSVLGFFQDANSWGQSFSSMLNSAGSSSTTGILSLASSSNSSIESTLNADISKEETLISAQQKSLTAELNSANEIMQELPSQLQGVNELYSAISGYNQNSNG